MTGTLYKHAVYCLHGVTGPLAADAGAGDTTFTVGAGVLADVSISVGATIFLADGTNTSGPLTVIAVDSGATTITTDAAPGFAFLAATPTDVVRAPHWSFRWSESAAHLSVCPQLASHPIQAGSAKVVDKRSNDSVHITQSQTGKTRPAATAMVAAATIGQTVVVDHAWPYDVTLNHILTVVESANADDRVSLEVGPDTPAGPVTAAVTAGDTVIAANAAALASLRPGVRMKINEGGTTDDLGYLIAVDTLAGTLTVETAAVNGFTPAANLLATIAPAWELPLPTNPMKFAMAKDSLMGSEVEAGRVLRVTYVNGGPAVSRLLIYFAHWT